MLNVNPYKKYNLKRLKLLCTETEIKPFSQNISLHVKAVKDYEIPTHKITLHKSVLKQKSRMNITLYVELYHYIIFSVFYCGMFA